MTLLRQLYNSLTTYLDSVKKALNIKTEAATNDNQFESERIENRQQQPIKVPTDQSIGEHQPIFSTTPTPGYMRADYPYEGPLYDQSIQMPSPRFVFADPYRNASPCVPMYYEDPRLRLVPHMRPVQLWHPQMRADPPLAPVEPHVQPKRMPQWSPNLSRARIPCVSGVRSNRGLGTPSRDFIETFKKKEVLEKALTDQKPRRRFGGRFC